jgi:uncharacterized membrane protein YeaQ/YmgE (transglycosylase-associated protein family)
MEGVGFIGAIIIGGIAGWIAERVTNSRMGLIANILLGIIGALFLNAVLRLLNLVPPEGWLAQLVVAAVGAILLIWLWRALRGRRMTPPP